VCVLSYQYKWINVIKEETESAIIKVFAGMDLHLLLIKKLRKKE
jgi:hypothetical protein